MESFRSTNELVTYLKSVTCDLIMCSMSMDHLKGYLDHKYDIYLKDPQNATLVIKYAEYAGLQPDGCMVYSTQVKLIRFLNMYYIYMCITGIVP